MKTCCHQRRLRRVVFSGIAALAASCLQAQTVLQSTESGRPGGPITVVGDDLRPTDVFLIAQVANDRQVPSMRCTVQRMNSRVAVVTVPSTLGAGLWRMQINRVNVKLTDSLLINRARIMSIDTDVCRPGETIRLYGNNLLGTASAVPAVSFLAPNGVRLPATVVSNQSHLMTIKAPSGLVAGTAYKLIVTNGDGMAWVAETTAPQTLTAVAADPDTLGLNVPWCGQFANVVKNTINVKTDARLAVKAKGDNVTDDTLAIQGAIDLANNLGGGVVYLPAGTYVADGLTGWARRGALEVKANVVLRGAGAGVTTIRYGMRYTPTNPPDVANNWLYLLEGGRNGVMDLTIQNESTSPIVNSTIRRGNGSAHNGEYMVLKNLVVKMNLGMAILMDSTRHALIDGCQFDSQNIDRGPVWLGGSAWMRFQNNQVTYRAGRIPLGLMTDSQVTGNTFLRDMNYATPGSLETGCLESSFAQRLVIQGNTITGVGPESAKGAWDGEMILTQRGVMKDFQYSGTVSYATATTLNDFSGTWRTTPWMDPNYRQTDNRVYVAIVSGKGAGQLRFVSSYGNGQVNLTQPWTIVPDATSTYVISTTTCYQQFILDNTITNGSTAIELYDGGIDSVVAGNKVNNSGCIFIRGFSQPASTNDARYELAWFNVIENNLLTKTSNLMPAAISLPATTVLNGQLDTLTLGNSVLNNRIDVRCPSMYYGQHIWAQTDGFWNFHLAQLASLNELTNLGTVFSGNTTSGVPFPIQNRSVLIYSDY